MLDCEDFCLFENENNSWCFLADPPALRVGWNWGQTFGEDTAEDGTTPKYWQIEFIPYIEV